MFSVFALPCSSLFAALPPDTAHPTTIPVGIEYWVAFGLLIVILLCLDLFVFHRHAHEPSLKESAGWSVFWIALALAFNVLIWQWMGPRRGTEFLTGYLVEKSLSMDNVFVFAMIFRFFRVPLKYQYNVLFWGILGAILMRLAFILAGAEMIERFGWVTLVFGAILIYTAAKLAFKGETEVHPEKSWVLRASRRVFRISREGVDQHGQSFFVREDGRWAITPLFLVLLVVESTDVLFAVDSVPAIFGITNVPFIVFTSNIFAILGLRALYFLLAGFIDLFRYLGYGLAAVLGFIGLKMVFEYAVQVGWATSLAERAGLPALAERLEHIGGHNGHAIPPEWSLVVVVGLLAVSIVASIVAKRREERAAVQK